MIRALYSVLSRLAIPFVWVRLLWKGRTQPAYRERRGERLGHVPPNLSRRPIWFHTVSAGETIGAAPIIAGLRERFPDVPFLVTTTTPTGSAEVTRRLEGLVEHCYAPYDFSGSVDRFLGRIAPRALVVMETELWPNLLLKTRATGAPVVLVNARLSERSARGYRRIGSLTRAMLGTFSKIVCQYEDTASRFRALGVPAAAIEVTGSVKFDLEAPPDVDTEVAGMRSAWLRERRAWVAGSTHEGEEEVLLAAHAALRHRHPDLVLVIVPRHPHRADDVVRIARASGFVSAKTSQLVQGPCAPSIDGPMDVVVGDQMGLLVYLYALAHVAFLGGSLDDTGGHNPIEAAVHGVPMVMGPSRINFSEVARRFEAVGCLHLGADAGAIAAEVGRLLENSTARRREGDAARAVVSANRGASAKAIEALTRVLRDVV